MRQIISHKTHAGEILLDARKIAFLPEPEILIVADLHFEKASYFQQLRGIPVPALDTRDTLDRLSDIIAEYAPRKLVSLGDSFHDARASARMSQALIDEVNELTKTVPEWIWVLGNHDPDISHCFEGLRKPHVEFGDFVLSHEPYETLSSAVNICGHLHPKLRLSLRKRRISGPVFACSPSRIIMPSFGTFTGGLWCDDKAIVDVLKKPSQYYLLHAGHLFEV